VNPLRRNVFGVAFTDRCQICAVRYTRSAFTFAAASQSPHRLPGALTLPEDFDGDRFDRVSRTHGV
jgi:hypothetical protein